MRFLVVDDSSTMRRIIINTPVLVNTDLIDELVKATEEVFETMVFKKLTTGAPIDDQTEKRTPGLFEVAKKSLG